MKTSDERHLNAAAALENRSMEVASTKAALRSAVEEHNMMAQEYYEAMEKFAQMNEELEWSSQAHQRVSASCDELESALYDQGALARKRLGEINHERDMLQSTLEVRNHEISNKAEKSVAAA